jgi:hypothetical protein
MPPLTEIVQRAESTAGKGRTYTSSWWDSLEPYAIHFPFGEITAA